MTRSERSVDLGFERTRVAYERTMLAWTRGATSLITFGFTIYKYFQLEGLGHARPGNLLGPREFAFLLVGIGLASLVLATIQYRENIRALGVRYGGNQRPLAVPSAALVAILGVIALVALIFRQ